MDSGWRLITNHGVVLFFIASHPAATIHEIATEVGLTERRVSMIIKDLREGGFLSVRRQSRRNHYTLHPEAAFRHPLLGRVPVQVFLDLLEAR